MHAISNFFMACTAISFVALVGVLSLATRPGEKDHSKANGIIMGIFLVSLLLMGGTDWINSKIKSSQQTTAQKKTEKKKEDQRYYNNRLKGFAQSFGNKPVSEIQQMPSTYVTERVGNKTIYGWHPEGLPELVRVDDPETNNTDVYVFDKNGQDNMLGKHLYSGRTIFQKQPKYIPQY